MLTKTIYRGLLHILVVTAIILQSLAAAWPSWALERQPTGKTTVSTPPAATNLSVSWLEAAKQQVGLQQARPEPTPASHDPILPPGTIGPLQATATSYHVFLPLIQAQSGEQTLELVSEALDWLTGTRSWPVHELGRIASEGMLTMRYPLGWNVTSSTGESLRISSADQTIHITAEHGTSGVSTTTCEAPDYPEIEQYQQEGYTVQKITAKGWPGWNIIPPAGQSLCREVIVAFPDTKVSIQLSRRDSAASCADEMTYDLLLSSLQIRVDTPSEAEAPLLYTAMPMAPDQVDAVNYNRTAALNYQATYCSQDTNSDGYYFWCSGVRCDGAHYLAHVLQAGGFPINASNHSDPAVRGITAQRSYIHGTGNVQVTSIGSLQTSDIIYINGGSWCWGFAVRTPGSVPKVSAHSVNVCSVNYNSYYCGTNPSYEGNHIDDRADPKINSGLSLTPATQQPNANVTAAFNVHNYGGQTVGMWLRVSATGAGDFASVYCTLGGGGDCSYNQTRSFATTGSFNTCAQMDRGAGWENIPVASGTTCATLSLVNQPPNTPNLISPADGLVTATPTITLQIQDTGDPDNYPRTYRDFYYRIERTDGSWALDSGWTTNTTWGVTLPSLGQYRWRVQSGDGAAGSAWSAWRYISLVAPADVRLSTALSLTLNVITPGQSVCASFSAQNYGGVAATEKFRASVVGSAVTFDETGNTTLNPGQTYSYSNCKTFSEPGIYRVWAEHFTGGSWQQLIGQSAGSYIQVQAPPPPPQEQVKGDQPTTAKAGEPVDTSTGNYFYNFTDLSDPTPGLGLNATRWYNSIDANAVAGPFGYGTSWTYNMTVTWRADKTAVVRMADGHLAYFVGTINPSNPTDLTGAYQGQGNDIGLLTRAADGTGSLKLSDQTTYYFNTAGNLIRISDTYPSTIDLSYSGGSPVTLAHSSGVTYTIGYTGSRIAQISSSTGRSVTYTYSPASDLSVVTRPDGSEYTYLYDLNHRVIEARDPNEHAYVQNVYDAQGRVIQQADQVGELSYFQYGALITATRNYTDALGNVITHTYDSNYRVIAEQDSLGHIITSTYNTQGLVTARRDKNGAIWRYTYDTRGNLLTETDPLSSKWIYTYDANNNRLTQTDPFSKTWQYQYDANNRLTHAINPLGHQHDYVYDGKGNLIWERDENGAETAYEYNALGLRTTITDTLGDVTRIAYDAFGNQTVYTDANGNVAYFFYDDLNRLSQSFDPSGAVITFTYDAMGNLLTESDGLGHLLTRTYDAYDRIVAETDFNGNVAHYGYDVLGRKTIITNALGFTSIYTYNSVGNLSALQDKDGTVSRLEYDANGRLLREIDPLGRVTEYVYDAAGRQTEVRRPCEACAGGKAVSQTTYDAAGRVLSEIDPRGATTRYLYDVLGRIAVLTDTYGYTQTSTYDPVGHLIQEVDAAGAVTRYAYDLAGHLITMTNALGYQTFNTYDAIGNLITIWDTRGYSTTSLFDASDRLIASIDPLGNATTYEYDAAGRLLATTDPLSHTTRSAYDVNGNRLLSVDARGYTSTLEYDALNRVIRSIDALGQVKTTDYDAAGRVISETNPLGATVSYTYDLAGRKIAERSPLGYTAVYTYDSANNLIARQEPTGVVWRFEYDSNGNQIRQIDPLGNVKTTEYDLLNRVVKETDALGAITRSQYDAAGRLVTQIDPRGAVTRSAYDALGQKIQDTNALGYTRVYTYDAAGNQMATQDERGFVTTTVFDGLNRAIAQTDALGQTRYTLYDAAGQTMAEIDYQGYATQRLYDATGNVIQTTDALSNTTTSEYDPLGRAISVTDPLSHTRRTAYDAAGRVVSETTPLGYTTIYTYNAEGWQTARLDPLGQVWATTFDQAGRPLVETDPLNRATRTEYDLLGRVDARVDALDRRTTYTYDPAGRLLTVTAPDGTTQRYTYDSTGNFLTEQDGNAHVTRYQYDLLGRQLRKTDPLGRIWQYRYDASGNQTGVATPYGHLLTQTYDELGRLTARLYDGVQNAAYGYDANGNRAVMTDTLGVTVYTYDALNRLTDSSDAAGRTAHYGYDAVGQRVQLTYPDGTVAHYAYDADGRLQQVTAPDGGVTHYSNDALGRTTRVVQGNGVTVETTYDGVGNALAITQRDSSNAIFAEQRFVVDAVNRRTQEVELLPQGTVTTTYAYDDLDHLTTSSASDGRITHYSFDNAGNRLAQWGTRTRNGALENFRTDYAYNPANQLLQAIDTVLGTTSYTYDADGNRTNQTTADRHLRLQYDAANRLVQAKVEIQQNGSWSFKDGVYERYGYDGDGRRVRKETWSGLLNTLNSQRDYRYDDTRQWDVLQSYNSAQPSAPNRYLYDQSLHKLAYWQGAGSGYLQNDSLGSVLGSTNLSGTLAAPSALMKYSDYGESLTVNAPLLTDDAFTGYELDAYSGLQYARYRYYDAATGSFITSDPFPADRQDVGDLHRYLYVQANPANDIDPLGLFRWTSASAGVIERGDTLWSIAAAYWRVSPYKVNWGMISAIQSANSWIKNPALIYAGYTLRLPTGVSASQSTAYLNQSAISDGTSESSCGQKPNSSSGSNNKNTSGSNKNNSANKSSNGTNNGTNTSQPTITDDTRGSPAWGLFNALTSELGVKVNSKKYRLDIPKEGKMSFNVPPLPVIGFAGGKFEFWFKFAAYMKFYWSQEKALAESARTGWCGGVGASAELEGSIPLWGPIRFGAWGAIEGEVGACTRGSWVSKNNLRIYLEPYGKIKGQIGAKLFLGLDLYVLGAKVSGEAGVKGSVNAEADFTKLQIWAELGPYVKGSAKIFGREVEGAWEKMFSTPRTTVQYSNFAKMFR